MTVDFTINGQRIVAINGGPEFTFDEAISLMIECEDQDEIDRYWEALISGGGSEGPCGWCKDRFGVSWQVVPVGMDEVFSSGDPDAATRAMQAMFGMKKLDLAELQRAASGTPA